MEGGINRGRPEGIVSDLGHTIVDDLALDMRRGYERIEAYLVGERGARDLYDLSLEQMDLFERREASLLEFSSVSFLRLLASRHGLAFRGTWEEIEREFLKAANPVGAVEGVRSVLEVFREEGNPPGHHQQLCVLGIRAIRPTRRAGTARVLRLFDLIVGCRSEKAASVPL
jgi:hypothetical protein